MAIDTILHEIVHVLGFSSSLFPMFIDKNGVRRTEVTRAVKVRGIDTNIIVTPKVLEIAR